jgi:hypothetical protein
MHSPLVPIQKFHPLFPCRYSNCKYKYKREKEAIEAQRRPLTEREMALWYKADRARSRVQDVWFEYREEARDRSAFINRHAFVEDPEV